MNLLKYCDVCTVYVLSDLELVFQWITQTYLCSFLGNMKVIAFWDFFFQFFSLAMIFS